MSAHVGRWPLNRFVHRRPARTRGSWRVLETGERVPYDAAREAPRGASEPRSRSVSRADEWPLPETFERRPDRAAAVAFERAESRILVEQLRRAPGLDETDRRILAAIVGGDGKLTRVELAAEAQISRATLYRRLELLEAALADLLDRETD